LTMQTTTISVTIERPADEVYEFVREASNFPKYTTLFKAVRAAGSDSWIADTDQGEMALRFAPQNSFRVLDHHVQLKPDLEVLNHMRVLPNADGAEVLFTVFQRPGMSDTEFEEDGKAVETDLHKLKSVLENG
jgi:hypothetical protein